MTNVTIIAHLTEADPMFAKPSAGNGESTYCTLCICTFLRKLTVSWLPHLL